MALLKCNFQLADNIWTKIQPEKLAEQLLYGVSNRLF